MLVMGWRQREDGDRQELEPQMRFLDADAFHSAEAVAKMSAGTPLTDADRRPWLGRLAVELACNGATVLACSALKGEYRRLLAAQLAPGRGLAVVFLNPARSKLRRRLTAREHFMPVSLLDSQLATLEPPAAEEPAIQMLISVALMARASLHSHTQPSAVFGPLSRGSCMGSWYAVLCNVCMLQVTAHRHRTSSAAGVAAYVAERLSQREGSGSDGGSRRAVRRRCMRASCPYNDGVQGQCSSRYVRGWTQKAIAS